MLWLELILAWLRFTKQRFLDSLITMNDGFLSLMKSLTQRVLSLLYNGLFGQCNLGSLSNNWLVLCVKLMYGYVLLLELAFIGILFLLLEWLIDWKILEALSFLLA